jgi:hypothetical protein
VSVGPHDRQSYDVPDAHARRGIDQPLLERHLQRTRPERLERELDAVECAAQRGLVVERPFDDVDAPFALAGERRFRLGAVSNQNPHGDAGQKELVREVRRDAPRCSDDEDLHGI